MTHPAPARIGHAHPHIRDLNRSIAFYEAVQGLSRTEVVADRFAFLSSGHHQNDLALQP